MFIRKYTFLVVLAILAIGVPSCEKAGVEAARDNRSDLTPQKVVSIDDRAFLMDARKTEVRQEAFANLALDRSRNLAVRKFAQRVRDERDASLMELRALMESKGITDSTILDDAIKNEATGQLDRASEGAFDHEFVSLMTAEGPQTLRLFDNAARTAEDPDIRKYASGVLGWLQQDFDIAANLDTKLAGRSGQQ